MSPFTNTGRRTACLTAATVSYSASPAKKSARVRPCTARPAMPSPSAMRAIRHGIAVLAVPAGAHLERDRHARGRDDGAEDPADQRFIAHERGARGTIADFLGGAAEVDVDDLGAELDVHARRFRHHVGVVAGDLHDARLGLVAVVEPVARLGRVPEAHVGGHHLGCRDARAHAPAEPAKRQVRHARHRRERERRRDLVRAYFHCCAVLSAFAQRTPPWAGRQTSSSKPTASEPGSTMRIRASARWPGSSSPVPPAPGR